jgi:hypothetical protein
MGKATCLDRKFQYYCLIVIMGFVLSIVNLATSLAAAPTEPIQQPAKLQNKQNKKPEEKPISADDEKLWLRQLEIYGQIAKPQTVFIVPGTDPRVDGLRIDRHFFSHIFRPVEKSTLQRVQVKQAKDKDHILW